REIVESRIPVVLELAQLLVDAAPGEPRQLAVCLSLALAPRELLADDRAPCEHAEHGAREHDHHQQQRGHLQLVAVEPEPGWNGPAHASSPASASRPSRARIAAARSAQ